MDARTLLTVWERGDRQDPVRRALTLLAAARDADPDDLAGLDLGTRDVLLARVLAETVGGRVAACADCPGCGAVMDVTVDVNAVADLPVHPPGRTLSVTMNGRAVAFRLPTSADLVAVSEVPAGRDLLIRCLGDDEPIDDELAAAVDEAMERADPAGAIDLLVACPACGAGAALPLDVGTLLWAEIELRAATVLDDVHVLASAYGWTEPEVLSLSAERRAAYLARAGQL